MTTYHLGGTDLTQLTEALADDDRFLVNNKSDTTTAPADADGSSQWIDAATAAKAFYRGALLVLPSASNVAATNATLVNSALSAAASAGIGVVKCAPVAWNWAGGTVLHDGSGLKLDLEGVTITGSGSGALIEMYDSIAFESRTIHGGGVDGDPWIDGTAMTGNSYAVHMGDIFEAVCNVRAIGFNAGSGSKGVWFDNRYAICEALHARIFTSGCKAGVVFDVNSGATATGAHVNATGSYMRSDLDLHVNQGDPGNDGIVFQNGAFLVDGVQLAIHGNYGTSASALTSAVVRVTGSTPSGITAVTASTIETTPFSWGMENDGGDANAPYTIFFGGDSNFIRNCTGVVGFGSGTPFKSSNNAGQFLNFVGVVTGDANLPSSLPQGSTNAADGSQAISATSATAIVSLALPVAAFTAYEIDAYIPHTGAGTTGTFTFALGGPSISTGNTSLDIEMWTTTTLTGATRNSTSATLDARAPSTSVRVLRVRGTLVCSASGTLTVTGAKTSGGSNVTVAAGAYLKLTPMSAP